jgi:hypothetical protein
VPVLPQAPSQARSIGSSQGGGLTKVQRALKDAGACKGAMFESLLHISGSGGLGRGQHSLGWSGQFWSLGLKTFKNFQGSHVHRLSPGATDIVSNATDTVSHR